VRGGLHRPGACAISTNIHMATCLLLSHVPSLRSHVKLLLTWYLLVSATANVLQDVHNLCIQHQKSHSNGTVAIGNWLEREVSSRQAAAAGNVHWRTSAECSAQQPILHLRLISVTEQSMGQPKYSCGPVPAPANSYVLSVAHGVVEIAANDESRLRQGAGRLLRELSMPGRHKPHGLATSSVRVFRSGSGKCFFYSFPAVYWDGRCVCGHNCHSYG